MSAVRKGYFQYVAREMGDEWVGPFHILNWHYGILRFSRPGDPAENQ
jgi:hypothetical protein